MDAMEFPRNAQAECGEIHACGLDKVCVMHRCVDESHTALPLSLRITSADALATTYIKEVEFMPGQPLQDMNLPHSVLTSVVAYYKDEPIEGYAHFTFNADEGQLSLTQTVVLGGPNIAENSRKPLLPGMYTVTVFPSNQGKSARLPTVVFNNIRVDAVHEDIELFIEDANAGEELLSLRGSFESRVFGYAKDITLQVYARDQRSAARSAQYVIHNEGMLRNVELLLPPQKPGEERVYDIMVKYLLSENLVVTQRVASVVMGVGVIVPNEEAMLEKDGSLSGVVIDSVSYSVMNGRIVDADGKAVSGAVITLKAEMRGDRDALRFASTALEPSQKNGQFALPMPHFYSPVDSDIEYTFSIAFDNDSKYASTTYKFGDLKKQNLVFMVKTKETLQGIVYGQNTDEPVPGARILASPKGDLASSYTLEGYSQENGEFTLLLNDTDYALIIQPPDGITLPPAYYTLSRQSSPNATHAIVLGRANLVYGRCIGSDGQGMKAAQIDIFYHPEGNTQLLQSTHTNADGYYMAVIPHTEDIIHQWGSPLP